MAGKKTRYMLTYDNGKVQVKWFKTIRKVRSYLATHKDKVYGVWKDTTCKRANKSITNRVYTSNVN